MTESTERPADIAISVIEISVLATLPIYIDF